MPEPKEKQALTNEPEDSFEKFAQEFHDSKYQQRPDDGEEPTLESTPDDPVEEPKSAEPAPDPDPAEEQKVEEPKEETPPEDDPDSKVTRYLVPDHETFGELRGKRATAAELEEAGLLDKMFTRAHQEMHHTKLYQELKKKFDEDLEAKLREAGVQPKPQQEQPKVDPKMYGDEVERAFRPHLEAIAKAGSFEPDFVEAYPRLASHLANQFENFRMVGAGLVKAVAEIKEHIDGSVTRETTTSNLDHLNNAMVSIAGEDPLYTGLSDPAERRMFVEWMKSPENTQPWKKLDIVQELSQPDTLKGAYAAFRTATRSLREPGKPEPRSDERRTRANLAGAGGGTSRTTTPSTELDEFAQMKRDIEASRAQRFGR